MNKRISSLLLCFVMVFVLIAIATPAFAETSVYPPITFTITPDKTTAKPGDTITYQVFVGPVEKLRTAQFELVIPDELEYTGGSSPEGLTAKMNAFSAAYTSASKIFVLTGTGEYMKLFIPCGGADDPRPIKMRQRGSDGKWFLWEQYLLTGVRTPKAADPWA